MVWDRGRRFGWRAEYTKSPCVPSSGNFGHMFLTFSYWSVRMTRLCLAPCALLSGQNHCSHPAPVPFSLGSRHQKDSKSILSG